MARCFSKPLLKRIHSLREGVDWCDGLNGTKRVEIARSKTQKRVTETSELLKELFPIVRPLPEPVTDSEIKEWKAARDSIGKAPDNRNNKKKDRAKKKESGETGIEISESICESYQDRDGNDERYSTFKGIKSSVESAVEEFNVSMYPTSATKVLNPTVDEGPAAKMFYLEDLKNGAQKRMMLGDKQNMLSCKIKLGKMWKVKETKPVNIVEIFYTRHELNDDVLCMRIGLKVDWKSKIQLNSLKN